MSSLQRLSQRTRRELSRNFNSSCTRRFVEAKTVQENDVVFLKNTNNPNALEIITHPLRQGRDHTLNSSKSHQRDFFRHDEIIGKRIRDTVKTRKGVQYRILEPTLNEYTDNSPRLVTPIYSQDANLIVSLLDLHPTVPGEKGSGDERLEIFEAGTGHGALTLNLARAIHAANPAAPVCFESRIAESPSIETTSTAASDAAKTEDTEYNNWRKNRRAVIHTLDCCEAHSKHAEKVVKNFRHGMYSGDIDFHVGSINDYISERLDQTSNTPFLQYAILDLPQTEDYFHILGRALKPNGILLTFCPSITQHISGLLKAKGQDLPFWLEKVVEIGGGIGVGGREWDIRPVKPRASMKAEKQATKEADLTSAVSKGSSAVGSAFVQPPQESDWSMICRPRVGSRVVGGGFVAVWRRTADQLY